MNLCGFMQTSLSLCEFLQVYTSFCKFLQVSARLTQVNPFYRKKKTIIHPVLLLYLSFMTGSVIILRNTAHMSSFLYHSIIKREDSVFQRGAPLSHSKNYTVTKRQKIWHSRRKDMRNKCLTVIKTKTRYSVFENHAWKQQNFFQFNYRSKGIVCMTETEFAYLQTVLFLHKIPNGIYSSTISFHVQKKNSRNNKW